MQPWINRLTQLKWQLAMAALPVCAVGVGLFVPSSNRIELASLDRSTFITALSAFASILALFCSLSIAWILFVSQQNKAERVTAYDLLKSRLLEVQRWLLEQPDTADRTVCLALAYEFDKLDLSDLPQTDRGDEYRAYCEALDEGLDCGNQSRRQFFLISSTHFGYIEHLLNRIGLVSIRQLLTRLFIDTLAKGVGLVALAVITLIVSTLWFNDLVKPWLVLVTAFYGIAANLLLFEVWIDVRRYYDDEIDFIQNDASSQEES